MLTLLELPVNHAILVMLARSVIRPGIVAHLSDGELIQGISAAAAAARDASRASQVVPEEIPIARAASGEDSGISSLGTHQTERHHAVEMESGSVGTFSIVAGAQYASEDDVRVARLLL